MLPLASTYTDVLPWVAILISSVALYLSVLNYRRDRAILQATSSFIEHWEGFNACLHVEIVNKGRRPIILSTWVGAATQRKLFRRSAGSNWVGHYFNNNMEGLTLSERQAHSFQLEASDLDFQLQNGEDVTYDDMWIVDTLGHRHRIKDIRKNIAALQRWAAKNPQSKTPKIHVVGQKLFSGQD